MCSIGNCFVWGVVYSTKMLHVTIYISTSLILLFALAGKWRYVGQREIPSNKND